MITQLRRKGDNDRTSSRKKSACLRLLFPPTYLTIQCRAAEIDSFKIQFLVFSGSICYFVYSLQVPVEELLRARNFILRLAHLLTTSAATSIDFQLITTISVNHGRPRRCNPRSVRLFPPSSIEFGFCALLTNNSNSAVTLRRRPPCKNSNVV